MPHILKKDVKKWKKNYRRITKIKPLKIEDRVYVKHVQIREENKKLQPLYDGPYRIIRVISAVVMKLKSIRTGKEITLHTDKMRVIPEESITVRENENVRRAYPLQELDYEKFVFPEYTNNEEIEDQKEIENQEEIGENETTPTLERDREEIQGETNYERIG